MQKNSNFCYHITVGGRVAQDTGTSAARCNAAGFRTDYTVGTYSTDLSPTKQFYDHGSYSWGCVTSDKTRAGYLTVHQDPSATETTAEVTEPTACTYNVKVTTPSCSAPTPAPSPVPVPPPQSEEADCDLDAILGEEFYAMQKNSNFCYHITVGGRVAQDTGTSAARCNAAGFRTDYTVGTYSMDLSPTKQFYDHGSYSWGCVTSDKTRAGYLTVHQD